MVAPLQYAKWKNNNEWRQWMKTMKLNTQKWKSLCHIENDKAYVSCNKNEKTWTKEGMMIQCGIGVQCKQWAFQLSQWFVIVWLFFD
jgi:hypothetical protein